MCGSRACRATRCATPRVRRPASRSARRRDVPTQRRRGPCARHPSNDARPCPFPPVAPRPWRSDPRWPVPALLRPWLPSPVPVLSFRGLAADFAVHHSALETARFIDDTFEQPRDGIRAERPLHRDVPHVLEHLLLALGLIDLDALRLLQAADLARHARALVQQPDEDLVHAIDVVSQIVKRRHIYTCRGRPSGRPAPFSQRTYSTTRSIKSDDTLDSAIFDTSALPTTAASA